MNSYNPQQAAQLKDIGQYLQQQRIYQKLTLEEVIEETLISLRVLQALEGGKIDQLPEKVYLKGCIRRYANLLGLDAEELVKTFSEIPDESPMMAASSSSQAKKEQGIASLSSQIAANRSNTQTLEPPQTERTSSPKAPSTKKGNSLPLLLGLAVLVGLGGYWFIFRSETSPEPAVKQESPIVGEEAKPSPSPSPLSVASSPSPVPSPESAVRQESPIVGEEAKPSPSPVLSPDVSLALDVVITADSWLKVVTDGQTAYEGILKKGEEKQWQADKDIEIRAGNAGGVQVGLNGQSPEPLGELGKIKEATFKAETLE